MRSRDAEARWSAGPLRCRVTMRDGFVVEVDEPVAAGGTGLGPQPTDLFLASLASCFTLALVYTAQKRDVTLDGVRVSVTGHYDGPRFERIDIRAEIDGLPEAERVQLLRAAERVCYVTNTLRQSPEINVMSGG